MQTLTDWTRHTSGWLGVLSLLLVYPLAASEHDHLPPIVLAPGYTDLAFEPPAPGSYALPPLWKAVDGDVLNGDGEVVKLHALMGEGPVLLSFIYTSCSDVNGCPLATYVLAKTATKLSKHEEIAQRVRLLSLSFDPDHDSPPVMQRFGASFTERGLDWRFLTTQGHEQLSPILEGYDQWVIRDRDEEGRTLGTMSHLLRVYLIDQNKWIRNIYSVSFLHADTLANDIRTLLMESSAEG